MGNRVSRTQTNVSQSQMEDTIRESWNELFGYKPSNEQIAMIMAQNSLETNNRKSMWNYNIGNLTTDGKGQYNFFDDLTTNEQVKPKVWKKLRLKYRAYTSLKEGVLDYLKFLKGKKYSSAWEHIENPNPEKFSKALKAAGYYTANEAPYTKAISKLYNQYSGQNQSLPQDKILPQNKTLSQKRLSNDNGKLSDIINHYLHMVASKKEYKKYLTKNDILIKVCSIDTVNAIEFSRILCAALEEELLAKGYTHTDKNNVEIECSINGSPKKCFDAVNQLANSLGEAFNDATAKIGNVFIAIECVPNKKSSYKELNFKYAEFQYRKFLLKFV